MAARLVRVALASMLALAGSGCHPILGPSQVDANWNVIDTPHFAIYVRPGSYAEQNVARLTEVLEDQFAFAVNALDIRYGGRISIFLFASAADAGEKFDRSGTAYPDTETVRATVSPPLETTFGLISHESNHVIMHNGIGRPATSFMNEGMASAVMSERFHPGGKTFLYPWTARNDARIPPMSDLADDDTWPNVDSQVAYNASASFLVYVLERYGPSSLKQLWPARSADFAARFQQVYGRALADVEREWRTYCAMLR